MYIQREMVPGLQESLARGKSIMLLGARQTGKTTMIKQLQHDRYINLMDPLLRLRYEATPTTLRDELRVVSSKLKRKPLVIIDEIQKAPELTDIIQLLIDEDCAQFILTGSSARKITNLLPGRVIKYILTPLSVPELAAANLPVTLEQLLCYGSQPEIITIDQNNREEELQSYVSLYLEEEIRKEALVRNLGAFSQFLRLAAIESGNILSFRKLAQEIGIAHTTISEYYNILIDCMLVYKIEALTVTHTRRKLAKSPQCIFFDLGVRRLAASEAEQISNKQLPLLFEQFIGLELIRYIINNKLKHQIYYWRDHAGPEVDYVLAINDNYIPIEIKWTDKPTLKDAKHLGYFCSEYNCKTAYIICQTPTAMQLADNIVALPWQDFVEVFA